MSITAYIFIILLIIYNIPVHAQVQEYKIDKDIPHPDDIKRQLIEKLPLNKMEVGDSVLVTDYPIDEIQKILDAENVRGSYEKERTLVFYRYAQDGNGVRVWRVR